ncbi:MAG: 4-hydroxy-tetrahydrodipicolinate synthase [Myxococcales bacterium]|nr:4-hydroxy-tetrahydrodipicolinate synthase [Myxococcales bacterium]
MPVTADDPQAPNQFRGAFTALITPMRADGRVDDEALVNLVERQIEAGIHGLVPMGTTGESATLSPAEHLHVVRTVTEVTAGRVPVLAGAGANNTEEALTLTRACQEIGVDGTLQVTPYYNKPTQAGLIAHFTKIAEEVDLPVILYNVPGRTGVDMAPDTVARLSEHPNIHGIKEASGDMYKDALIRERCVEGFSLLSGDDFTILPFMSLGGDGVISVVSNVLPDIIAKLCESALAGGWTSARALHYHQLELTRALFLQSNPIPVKAAMAMLGLCEPGIRLPLLPLNPESPDAQSLRAALQEVGALQP